MGELSSRDFRVVFPVVASSWKKKRSELPVTCVIYMLLADLKTGDVHREDFPPPQRWYVASRIWLLSLYRSETTTSSPLSVRLSQAVLKILLNVHLCMPLNWAIYRILINAHQCHLYGFLNLIFFPGLGGLPLPTTSCTNRARAGQLLKLERNERLKQPPKHPSSRANSTKLKLECARGCQYFL